MAGFLLGRPWARALRSVEREIWEQDLDAKRPVGRWLVNVCRVGLLVWAGCTAHRLTTRAAALTYTTVFSLVPMLAVALAIFEGFGGVEHAKNELLPTVAAYLAVGVRDEFTARLDQILDNIGGGTIGAVGFLFLTLAAFSLLRSMEDTFNEIWGVKRRRSHLQRLVIYWFVLTITPLVVVAVSVPSVLKQLGRLRWLLDFTGTTEVVVTIVLPLAFVCCAFSLMYAVLTSARIPWRSAMIGGVFGGVLWSGAVIAYAYHVQHSEFYATIYGSLSAIPVFLLWLYLSWLIVLLGAQVGFAASSVANYREQLLAADASRAFRERLALRIAVEVAGHFVRGQTPLAREELVRKLQAPRHMLHEIVDELFSAGVLVPVEGDEHVAPGRDPRQLTPGVLLDLLRHRGGRRKEMHRDRLTDRLDVLYAEMAAAGRAAVAGVSIADLALEDAGTAPPRPPEAA